ncbi:uncharacterized protein TNCV_1247121 [Trichonephila clavipes]|uniref:Uncharacterized protein n=1 Tax=Trichonephila clavipes TaxID=2585209 RepID=A0A8X6REX5_TRICX|nr:uncharacterized protein TNCV_1247121 [Trichonephila clavipes]
MDGKGLVLPGLTTDDIAKHARFLILSLPNKDMMKKSPFVIHKVLIGIGGEPKSIKRLRSGDLLIETSSAVQTKYFFLAKTCLDSPLTISPHKSLNSSRGVISEPDLLSTPETEILDGFSDQDVIQSPHHLRRLNSSAEIPTIQIKSLLPIPIPTTSPSNNLNTFASSLLTEVAPVLTAANKSATLSKEVESSVSSSESAAPASNDTHFNASQIQKQLRKDSSGSEIPLWEFDEMDGESRSYQETGYPSESISCSTKWKMECLLHGRNSSPEHHLFHSKESLTLFFIP